MSDLDTKQLRLFEVLYATRSVSRTAERLDLSQPTVSISLGKLRQQFKDPLFVRTPDGMQPTPHAESLIAPVRETLNMVRSLAQWHADFDPATARRKFRIGMTDASHITLLPHILSRVRDVAPHVEIEAVHLDAHTPLALQTGEVDLALGLVLGMKSGFFQQTLYTQDWVCLAQRDHPRIPQILTDMIYRSEAHISIESGTGQPLLEKALTESGIERRVMLRLPGFLGLTGILSTTDLIATLPRHIGETLARNGRLQIHACPFHIPGFTVKQHWHDRYHHDKANRWIRSLCAELFLKGPFTAGDDPDNGFGEK